MFILVFAFNSKQKIVLNKLELCIIELYNNVEYFVSIDQSTVLSSSESRYEMSGPVERAATFFICFNIPDDYFLVKHLKYYQGAQ